MKLFLVLGTCIIGFFMQNTVCAQEPTPSENQNTTLVERLHNAEITEKKTQNGSTITEIKLKGSLQPNYELPCISMSEVKSKYNPPALFYAAKKCILQDEYSKAWALLTTGNGFAYYDIKRLADRSTQGARAVLTMNVFSDLTTLQQDKYQKISKETMADPELVQAYCAALTKLGVPTYEPTWAILHGIGSFKEPRNGDYLSNIDTKELWAEVLKNRCTVIKK